MTKRILFVCTGNSARSQMAEGFAKALGMEAFSAGTHPKEAVHPLAIAVMAEKGIDISQNYPKPLDLELAKTVDLIVTVCSEADEECAQLPLPVPKIHWNLPDPAKVEGNEFEKLQAFRKIRDEIERLVSQLNEDLKG
ncbi:MAG: arsenate reductase ArsC [Armatimonadetes bacterium]|nr:arsenate reductase ArsC [Armatimonadota bacterium]MDW8028339.1 arsenate reductase ArsC [Armatimonadota bacterium]